MKIALFTTGGTIASVPTDRGLTPGLSGEALLRLCPDLMGFDHDIEVIDILSKDSSNMQPADWFLMANRIRSHAPACDTVVLLHGTDTMTWTAAALSYLLNDVPVPVVLTGSMLTPDAPGSDASDNIFAAIQFAMQLAMYRRRGVSIAFGEGLIHGPRAAKADSSGATPSRRSHAFISVDYPLRGEMKDRGTHRIAWLSPQTPRLAEERPWGPSPAVERNIALLPVFPGMRTALLDTVVDAGPRAIVLEGYGLGGIPSVGEDLLPSIKRGIDAGVPFVVRTQALLGGTDLDVYEVGRQALELGVISARDLTREALMTKIMLTLPLCSGRDELEHLLGVNLCDDVLL